MIEIRPFAGLGHADHGWLNARHHFSFASYHDPARMGWGRIRVWNDDAIAPHSGFPPHPHDNMEIITFVRSGAISHKDSLGSAGRTAAGDVQVMSAGTGIVHSEANLEDEPTTLFQIWIETDRPGAAPAWGQREFPRGARAGRWNVLANGQPGDDQTLLINANAQVLAASLTQGERLDYAAQAGRVQYLVAASGTIRINGLLANARDGVAIAGESRLKIEALDDAEIVLVDTTA